MPTSRLELLCDRILEATWLAALVVAPLFFNLYSNRIFDQDKIGLVRSLALCMIGVWLVKQIETRSLREGVLSILRSNPLVIPTAGIALAWLIATILSISTPTSFWGSYQRGEGIVTLFALLAIFLIAAGTLREPAQFHRTINVILVASFPVALYGIVQHWQLDPLPWDVDVSARVASSVGNAVTVAAYLMMVAPLTLARCLETIKLNLARAVVYGVILLAQLLALVFTQGRGAMIGLASGLVAFGVLYAIVRGKRVLALGALGATVVLFLFFVVLNLPVSPLEPLKSLPYVGRFGEVFEGGAATGKTREIIWQGALQLVLPHAPIWSPTTGDDPLNAIRPLVGYGPDTLLVAYTPFYPSDLGPFEGRYNAPDRSHNATFDALAMTGLLGLGAYLFLFTCIFYSALKWLGLLATRVQRNLFLALWCGGGLGLALLAGLAQQWNWLGVALPAGMLLGFFVFLVAQKEPAAGEMDPRRALWLSALGGALLAYYVEAQFGIGTISTELNFWIYTALLIGLGTNQLTEAVAKRSRRAHVAAGPSFAPALIWSAITALMLTTLCFGFLNNRAGLADALQVIANSLGGESLAVGALVTAAWIAAGLIGSSEQTKFSWRTLALFALLTLGMTTLFVAFQTFWLTQRGDIFERLTNLLATYYLSLFAAVLALALGLYLNTSRRPVPFMRTPAGIVAIPVALLVVGGLIYTADFKGILADVFVKVGNSYYNTGAWDRSISAYERARALEPDQPFYALSLGRAYQERARSLNDPAQREQGFQLSERTLLEAQRLNPFSMEYALDLGQMQRAWGMAASDPASAAAHFAESAKELEVATRLSPNMPYMRNEWAQTYLQAGDLGKARAQLDESLRLDPTYAQTYFYLGEYYRIQKDVDRAGENYLHAIGFDHTALSDASGKLFAGPLSILTQPAFLPRALEAYRNFSVEFPESIVPKRALEDLAKAQAK